jgi:D-alanine-D-alanine ligase
MSRKGEGGVGKPRVIVVMGGPSGEHEVSMASGRMVVQALDAARYDVTALVIGRDGQWSLIPAAAVPALDPKPQTESIRAPVPRDVIRGVSHLAEADVVFIALHGQFGEDGTLQGLLETVGVPYTGSGPLASALAMHKQKAKELFHLHGLDVPRGLIVRTDDLREGWTATVRRVLDTVGLPAVVKPNRGGSSLGASLAESPEELEEALRVAAARDTEVLVEERLDGVEVTCAVVEELDGTPAPLPLIEIVPHRGRFFDFRSKYESGGADEIVPARLSDEATRRCQDVAVRAHRALGCEGFSRTDMFLTARGPVVLEVNTIPGMTPNSLLPKAARAAGRDFPTLMSHLVDLALARHARRHTPWSGAQNAPE